MNLVLVAGHAIYRDRADVDPADDAAWWLAEFQRGEGAVLEGHLRRGVEVVAGDPDARLVLSGGRTRAEAPWSEAEGLARLGASRRWWGRAGVGSRVVLEAFARDSLENLLFGLARFREVAGRWPEHVTVVTWPFKAARLELHRAALRWPADRFAVEGVGEPARPAETLAGEARARAAFARDPYGRGGGRGGELAAKRAARDPHGRGAPYAATCPELAPLLEHAGPGELAGPLPWDAGAAGGR